MVENVQASDTTTGAGTCLHLIDHVVHGPHLYVDTKRTPGGAHEKIIGPFGSEHVDFETAARRSAAAGITTRRSAARRVCRSAGCSGCLIGGAKDGDVASRWRTRDV